MRILFALLFLTNIKLSKSDCVDINNTQILNLLNTTYNEDCYKHTVERDNCCEYMVVHEECNDAYKECVKYENYILNKSLEHCHSFNESVLNISYSDECHEFTLHLEPYCCDNIMQEDCIDWYVQCENYNTTFNKTCNIPTNYRNNYCSNFTKHINHNCCENFDDHCLKIYEWCIDNNPHHESILDLFVGPRNGYTIGSTITVYDNIQTIEECGTLCFDLSTCMSFDYIETIKHCHINKHVLGDVVDGNLVTLKYNKDLLAYYYERKHNMPHHDTLCNIKKINYLGDGFCDINGGYNTPHCGYDGGDCCKASCDSIFCGYFGYQCIDPVYNPAYLPTVSPTSGPTLSPTYKPTSNPSSSPTSSPTSTPTSSPSIMPTIKPSQAPSYSPSLNPTKNMPTISPTIKQITLQPSHQVTNKPTNEPTTTSITNEPTNEPTHKNNYFTDKPTTYPTKKPTIRLTPDRSVSKSDSISGVAVGLIIMCILVAILSVAVFYLVKSANTSIPISNVGLSRGLQNPVYLADSTNNNISRNTSGASFTDVSERNDPDGDSYEENTEGLYDDVDEADVNTTYDDDLESPTSPLRD